MAKAAVLPRPTTTYSSVAGTIIVPATNSPSGLETSEVESLYEARLQYW